MHMATSDHTRPAGEDIHTPADRHEVLIFVHVPKTGGMTLDHMIRRQYPDQALHWISYDRPELLSEFQALDAKKKGEIRGLLGHVPFGIDAQLSGNPVYITMLRDPVTRFISEYHQVRRMTRPGAWRPPVDQVKSMTLDDFLNYRIENNTMDVQTAFIGGYIPPAGTQPPFEPLPENALQRAKDNLRNHFVVVGLTERFDESLLLMKRRLGWNKHLFYARRNVVLRSASDRDVPPETLERIVEHTRLDAELVRFSAALLDEAVREEGEAFQIELRKLRWVNHAVFLLTNTWKRSPLWVRNAPGLRHVRTVVHNVLR
ncbi:MAG: sulfotransferase family 2 domain-containing protein [Candidatus Tectomicrobia bacterium]|nr:sulfotransferase family 2 domain-containing protein [Candidatus Tectomicrobia bacterium]